MAIKNATAMPSPSANKTTTIAGAGASPNHVAQIKNAINKTMNASKDATTHAPAKGKRNATALAFKRAKPTKRRVA